MSNPRTLATRLFTVFLVLTLVACSEDPVLTDHEKAIMEKTGVTSTYKGVFASQTSRLRGTFDLSIPGSKDNFSKNAQNGAGKITLHTGEVFEAVSVQANQRSKSSDFIVYFESEDLSFNFRLDENDQPVISDVVLKEEEGSVMAAEHTEEDPVTPVTGTYKCTNCQDQENPIGNIDLNNEERTFNMLLTQSNGETSIGIQALVGILVDTEVIARENCTTYEQFTICHIKSGESFMDHPLTWSGVHRYTTDAVTNEECSTISGIFAYDAKEFGSIRGEFKSDNSCPGNTYYVSATGSDSNTGLSPNDAFRSIAKINSIDLQAGETVLFEGGQSFEGNIYLDHNDANNGASPVKISSYGSGRAVIQAGDSYGVYAYNTAGVVVDNLVIAGSGMNSNKNSGIMFYNDLPGNKKLDFIEVTNCEVYGFRNYGIVIGAWNDNSGFSNVLIENNKVHDILDVGISSYGKFSSTKTGYAHSNITVRNCEVYNIKGYSKKSHSGNGIVLSDVQFSTIEHCTVYDSGSGNTNCGGPVGIWYWDADQVTIQFSEAYNISSGTGCDGGGFDMDGGVTNGIMQYNYSHDNDGAGFLVGQFTGARPMRNIIVRYNISENDAATNGGSVYLFNGENSISSIKDIYVHNNTFFLSEKTSNKQAATVKYIYWKALGDNLNFYNNILYAKNGANLIDIPATYSGNFKGNLYYSPDNFNINYQGTNYSSLESFRSTGNEVVDGQAAGIQANPMLTNPGQGGIIGFGNPLSGLEAYKIRDDSPAMKAGISLPFDIGDRDFYGSHLSQDDSQNIGAHKNDAANQS